MKKFEKPTVYTLGMQNTSTEFEYDCMNSETGNFDEHRHCPVCGESSSSCNHIDWTPILPGIPNMPSGS